MADELKLKAADMVTAYINNHPISADDVPRLLQSLIETLSKSEAQASPDLGLNPAVPIGDSIQHDHLVCLEDGARVKMLKRYLKTHFNMTPEQYIRKWGLPDDYPMVCPAYSESRREIAVKQGLGKS